MGELLQIPRTDPIEFVLKLNNNYATRANDPIVFKMDELT